MGGTDPEIGVGGIFNMFMLALFTHVVHYIRLVLAANRGYNGWLVLNIFSNED